MSQENVEIVLRAYEAWNAGDMAAFRGLCDEGIIVRSPEGWPEPGPFVGRDAVMRQFEQMRETWDADAIQVTREPIDAGGRVLARFIWRGAGSGPQADLELSQITTLHKGKVTLIEYFWEHAEALEAVGLSEQDAHADP